LIPEDSKQRLIATLLDAGAEVDDAGPDGKTALMFAAMVDRVSVVERLLGRGASLARTDEDGRSALDYAEAMGATGAARLLRRSRPRPRLLSSHSLASGTV
jgi:uncharacterized protein